MNNKIIINGIPFIIESNNQMTLYHTNELDEDSNFFMDLLCKKLEIKKIKIKKELNKYSRINSNIFECSICLQETKETEYSRLLKCGHKFHKKCIDKWIIKHNTCPICRTLI